MVDTTSKLKGLRFARGLGVGSSTWYFIVATIVLLLAFFLLLFDVYLSRAVHAVGLPEREPSYRAVPGIFPTVTNGNGSVIDFAVVFAIIMYGILVSAVHALVSWLDRQIVRNRLAASPVQPTV